MRLTKPGVRTSGLFPSAATISAVAAAGEQPFQPTTGERNWFLEFHNDSNWQPPCVKEYASVFEWYLDNFDIPYYSNLNIQTLYTHPAGYVSPSYTSLTLTNYRLHAPWNSTVYLGPMLVSSTQSSVLNAF